MPADRFTIRLLGVLSASLAAGYGVLFTVVGDYRDTYGISDTQVGVIIGLWFLSAFVAQVFLAPSPTGAAPGCWSWPVWS